MAAAAATPDAVTAHPLVAEIHLAHTPAAVTVYAALFRSVQNSAFLRAQLQAGNAAFEYALVDAAAILSTAHVLGAVFRAVTDALAGRLRSRNVHAEVVFALSPNNNIAEAFRRFGVGDGTQELLALKIVGLGDDQQQQQHSLESVAAHLVSNVRGTLVPFSDAEIARASDLAGIRKAYKLGGLAGKPVKGGTRVNGHSTTPGTDVENAVRGGDDRDVEGRAWQQERREIETAALGLMALKGS